MYTLRVHVRVQYSYELNKANNTKHEPISFQPHAIEIFKRKGLKLADA